MSNQIVSKEYFWIYVLVFVLAGALLFNYMFYLKRHEINKTVDQELKQSYDTNVKIETSKIYDLHHPEDVSTFPLHFTSDDYDRDQYPDVLTKYPMQLRDPYITLQKTDIGPVLGQVLPIDFYNTGFDEYYKVGFIYSGPPQYYRIQLFAVRKYPYDSNVFYIQSPNGVDKIKLPYTSIHDNDMLNNIPGYPGVQFQATIYNDDSDAIRYNFYF